MTESLPPLDAALVRRIQAGDSTAFDQIYDAYYERLWRLAYSYVRTRAVAQEIVHDIFLALWVGRETLRVTTTLDGYLYGAVRNHALKFVRHEHIVEREGSAAVAQQTTYAAGERSADAHESLERAELAAALRHAIAELPERHRTAVLLRWRHGMRYEQLAAILEVSPQAARTLVLRVQNTLRAILSRSI